VLISPRKPSPSAPSRRSAAISHVVEEDLGVADRALAHLAHGRPHENPGSPRSSTKAVMPRWPLPGSTVAKIT
jgi:hypothetical protein